MLKEAKVDDRLSPSQKEIIRNRRLSSNDRLPVHGESPGDTENRLTQTRRRRTARDRGGQTVRGSKLPKYNKHAEFGGVTYQKDLNPDKVSARRSELRAKRAKNNIRSFKEGKTFSEFLEEAKRIKLVRMYHGTPKSSADKIKKSGFNTSDVYTSTDRGIAQSFGSRHGEKNTEVISFRVPKKSIGTPGKVMKTDGQRAVDKWGREHYSTTMNPKYAEKHISNDTGVIHSPKIPVQYRKKYFKDNPNSRFKPRTKTQPKRK
jgi:hypothetical protein